MKRVPSRSVESDLCYSILKYACWDKAELVSFICSNDVNTSNVNIIWQLVVAGQYLHASKSFMSGVHLLEHRQHDKAGRCRSYVPEFFFFFFKFLLFDRYLYTTGKNDNSELLLCSTSCVTLWWDTKSWSQWQHTIDGHQNSLLSWTNGQFLVWSAGANLFWWQNWEKAHCSWENFLN